MDDWWNRPNGPSGPAEPVPEGEGPAGSIGQAAAGRSADGRSATCPWCSASAPAEATVCPSCGAAMSQRETLGGIALPGVTHVDPSMVPPSLTQSALKTSATMRSLDAVRSAAGTDAQLVVAGAILAKDGLRGIFQAGQDPSRVGEVSAAALEMARRLNASPDDSPSPDGEGPESDTPANQPG